MGLTVEYAQVQGQQSEDADRGHQTVGGCVHPWHPRSTGCAVRDMLARLGHRHDSQAGTFSTVARTRVAGLGHVQVIANR